jgi:L-ascorbate metabolism protein UlaG (beta-lactamase superfamily)
MLRFMMVQSAYAFSSYFSEHSFSRRFAFIASRTNRIGRWLIPFVLLLSPALGQGTNAMQQASAYSSPSAVTEQERPSTNASDRDYIADDAPKPSFVSSPRRLLTAPELLDAPDEWITRSLAWVDFILDSYPPATVEYPVRRAALIRMDDILHIQSAPHKQCVQQFYKERMEKAIAEIEQTQVTQGMRIWKLYNHGFFIRTQSVSFTFDLVPGGGDPDFALSPDQIRRLAAQSDATFISHLHGDHASKQVARAFLAAGKPVIAPPNLWADDPEFKGRLLYAKRGANESQAIPLNHKNCSLDVVAYPGHQGPKVENNVYLVTTPEHFSVVHTGDQAVSPYTNPDFAFFGELGRTHHVDVLLPNVWAPGLSKIIQSVHPQLVITGHENEMGHVVPHREDYTQTYTRLFGTAAPYLVMTWGETYHYLPAAQ